MAQQRGLRHHKNLKLGMAELTWLQEEGLVQDRETMRALSLRHGLVVRPSPGGYLHQEWRVHDDDADGVLEIDPGVYLVDENYSTVELIEDDTTLPTVPDDGTWRTLVCRVVLTDYMRGTLALTGASTAIVGTDTEFLRFLAQSAATTSYGTKIRLDAADVANPSNAGEYTVDTITDDENLTLTAAPAVTESGVRFTVAGRWEGSTPTEADILVRPKIEWELVTRTREAAAGDLIVADVMLDTATATDVQVIPRQGANLHKLRRPPMQTTPGFVLQLDDSNAIDGVRLDAVGGVPGGAMINCRANRVRYSGTRRLGVVVTEGTDVEWFYRTYSPEEDSGWTQVKIAANRGSPAFVQAPDPDGTIHAFVIASNNAVEQYLSTDGGGTWTGGTTIWDASNNDVNDGLKYLDAFIHSSGRMYVIATYYDDSAGTNYLRVIFSDDYGTTWDINSDDGHAVYDTDELYFGNFAEHEDGSIWITACDEDSTSTTSVAGAVLEMTGTDPSTWTSTLRTAIWALDGVATGMYDPSPVWVGDTLLVTGTAKGDGTDVWVYTLGFGRTANGALRQHTQFKGPNAISTGGGALYHKTSDAILGESGMLEVFYCDDNGLNPHLRHCPLSLHSTPIDWVHGQV